MAIMIPDEVDQFTTEGEHRFYDFLRVVAKPDQAFTVWYNPDVEDREPDFILYHDRLGLVILEVKDWALNQVIEADRKQFKLLLSGTEKWRANPLEQAHQYRTKILETLRRDGRLVSLDPAHHGNPRVPVATGAVFTNISKHQFVQHRLDQVVNPDHTFFWDDLHPQSPYYSDRSGRRFTDALAHRFPPLFPCALTSADRQHLKQLLFPLVRVQAVRRPWRPDFEAHNRFIAGLDDQQERHARAWGSGHWLIKGRSGSGKTLVLVHKAAMLLRYNPQVRRVLYVCFNLSLVSYVKRLLGRLGVPLGDSGVEVLPFYELCARINGDKVDHQVPEGEAYYPLVLEEALERSKAYPRYDAILVDETQDFSDDMMKVVLNLLNPATDHLTLVLDEAQNLYATRRAWSSLGIRLQGRVRRLDYVYRSTRELTRFAARFAKDDLDTEGPPQSDLFPESFSYSGPPPCIERLADWPALIEYVAQRIGALADEGYSWDDMAVIYLSKEVPGLAGPLPPLIQAALERRGILSTWLSQDARSKATYDITTESVTLSTVHSVKGLDYAAVFVLGLDGVEPNARWSAEQLLHIAYVAVTRARYRLYIPHTRTSAVLDRILGIPLV